MADVIVEEVTPQLIEDREGIAAMNLQFRLNKYGTVDPRAEYKLLLKKQPVTTMIAYEVIGIICENARLI